MSKIVEIAGNLKARNTYQISIMNCDNNKGSFIAKKLNQVFFDTNHQGDLSIYLNTLKKQGYNRVQIHPRLKNGSGERPAGEVITVILNEVSKIEPTIQNQTIPPITQPQPSPQPNNNMFGLNGGQILNGWAAQRENLSLIQRIKILEEEVKAQRSKKQEYRTKCEKLDRKVDMFDYETNKQPGALDKLISTLAENPAAIPQIISAFKPAAAGLGGSIQEQPTNPDEDLSIIKQRVIESIRTFPDEIVTEIYKTLKKYKNNDVNYIEAYVTLNKETILKKAENG